MVNFMPYILTMAAVLFWVGDLLVLSINSTYCPFGILFFKWLASTIVIAPLAFNLLVKEWPIIKQEWGKESLISLAATSSMGFIMYLGMSNSFINIDLSIISFIILAIVYCILISFYVYDGKISKKQMIGFVMFIFGILIFLMKVDLVKLISKDSSPISWIAFDFNFNDLVFINLAMFYGFYVSVVNRSSKLHPYTFINLLCLIGVVFNIVPYLLFNNANSSIDPNLLFKIIVFAVVPMLGTLLYGVKHNVIGVIDYKLNYVFTLLTIIVFTLFIFFKPDAIKLYQIFGSTYIYISLILINSKTTYIPDNNVVVNNVEINSPNEIA